MSYAPVAGPSGDDKGSKASSALAAAAAAVSIEIPTASIVTAAAVEPSSDKSHWENIQWQQRPERETGPLDLDIVIAFKKWDVTNSSSKEMLTWEGTVEIYWTDKRLIHYPTEFGMPENIFRPTTMGNKGFDLGAAESGKLLPKFETSKGLSDGRINMKVNFFIGDGGVNLADQLQRFRAFPFDSVRVDNALMMLNPCKDGDSPPYFNTRFCRPNVKTRLADGAFQHVDWTATRHSDDYALVNFAYAIAENPKPTWGNPAHSFQCLCLSLQIARTPSFYVHKGIVPLYLVSFFGLLTYALEPIDLSSRISVLSALFLTVYAIQWVTIERLPRLPFSTVLDGVAQSCVLSLIMIVIGACLAHRVGRPKGGCWADCLDFDLPAAEMVDYTSASIVLVYIFGYSLFYETVYSANKVSLESGWSRPWVLGKSLFNLNFVPLEGLAYRLETTEAWYDKYMNKYLGEGAVVDAATW